MPQKISAGLAWFIKAAGSVLLMALVCLVFAQVVLRYFFNSGLPWSEEMARYLFVWVCFLGAALAVRNRGHITVEVVRNAFPKFKAYFEAYYFVTVMLFFGFLMFYGFEYSADNIRARSTLLPVNMAQVYGIIPVSALFAEIFLCCEIAGLLSKKKQNGEGAQ